RAARGARLRHGRAGRHRAGASPRAGAAADQYPARSRRGCGVRAALSAGGGTARGRHRQRRAGGGAGESRPGSGVQRHRRARTAAFCAGRRDHGAKPAPKRARAAHHGRGLSPDPRRPGRPRLVASAPPDPPAAPAAAVDHHAPRLHLMPGTVHVVGAGLAGAAAGGRLGGRDPRVIVHEAAGRAGGRCRSYHDPALDMVIDNGNHLLLSANHAALSYLDAIGAGGRLAGPPAADFAFMDLANGERWTLRINAGRLPWWIFSPHRRVPGTSMRDYLPFARLLFSPAGKTICGTVTCAGPLYQRLARPLWLAALNTEPQEGSAQLAGAVIRETLAAGGAACRPLVARDGLGPVFIEPALRFLRQRGVEVRFGHRLRALEFAVGKVGALDFGEDTLAIAGEDGVILALPPLGDAG